MRRNIEAIGFHFLSICWVARRCQISETFFIRLASFVDLGQLFLFFITISILLKAFNWAASMVNFKWLCRCVIHPVPDSLTSQKPASLPHSQWSSDAENQTLICFLVLNMWYLGLHKYFWSYFRVLLFSLLFSCLYHSAVKCGGER